MKEKTTESSSNIFTDMGFDSAGAAILKMRPELMGDLRNYIEAKKTDPS